MQVREARPRARVNPVRIMAAIPFNVVLPHLGLASFDVGIRRGTKETGEIQVIAWWIASIRPSFDPPLLVGVVHEERYEGGPGPGNLIARGFVAEATVVGVASIKDNPVANALAHVNILAAEPPRRKKYINCDEWWDPGQVMDGVSYDFHWQSRESAGHFRFSNPQMESLKEVELALLKFAKQIMIASGQRSLEGCLKGWARYCGSAEEPVCM